MKTNKQLQADHRKKKRDSGLIPKEIWIHPDDWLRVKIIIMNFNEERSKKT